MSPARELGARIAEAKRDGTTASCAWSNFVEESDIEVLIGLIRERAVRLAEALRRYGEHDREDSPRGKDGEIVTATCAFWVGEACTCGLSALLAARDPQKGVDDGQG